jgi:hypothetical protein
VQYFTIKPGDAVTLYDDSGESIGDVSVEGFADGWWSGRFAASPGFDRVRHLFAEWEDLVDNQILSLLDESEKKIDALGIQARIGEQTLPVSDLQIYPNEAAACFRVTT